MLTMSNNLMKSRNLTRFYSASQQMRKTLHERPDPHLIKLDYIGPPDKDSNLRPYVRCIPQNETSLEESLRLKRLSVEEWNQCFWSKHNKRFYDVRSTIQFMGDTQL